MTEETPTTDLLGDQFLEQMAKAFGKGQRQHLSKLTSRLTHLAYRLENRHRLMPPEVIEQTLRELSETFIELSLVYQYIADRRAEPTP